MKRNQNIKLRVFGFLLMLLCMSFIQQNLHFINVVPLYGVVESNNKPEFNFKDWFSGEYQRKYEANYEENAGFKNDLIKLYNQIDYTFFHEGHGVNVVVGEHDYLFQQDYIDEITGKKFIGKSSMEYKVRRLKAAQDYLQSQGKLFFTVLAPGKISFFKEYIPSWLLTQKNDTTNYSLFIRQSESAKLNVLDFKKWFLSMKDTSTIPLFPRQGIHWSYYGMALAVDSIFNYISSKGIGPLTDFSWSLEFPDNLRGTDYDIGDMLNLMWKLPYQKMAYPIFKYSEPKGVVRPRVMIIGDSFNWTPINADVFKNMFGNYEYYYYFKTIHRYDGTNPISVEESVLLDEIKKYDVVMILQSEANYNDIGFGFEEKLLNDLSGTGPYNSEIFAKVTSDPSFQILIKNIMDAKQLDQVKAIAFLSDSLSKDKENVIVQILSDMRNNPEWIESIRKKAEENHIPLEEAMKNDAEWLYNRDNK